jgi:hypothetical protein
MPIFTTKQVGECADPGLDIVRRLVVRLPVERRTIEEG